METITPNYLSNLKKAKHAVLLQTCIQTKLLFSAFLIGMPLFCQKQNI